MNTVKNTMQYQYNQRLASPAKQRGASLFIALIALVSMTLAGIAMVRSVDTTNVIAGNMAFRQSALHTTDVGIEAAVDALAGITGTALESRFPTGCNVGECNYYPAGQVNDTIQATDANGVPTMINWALVPTTTVNIGYSVQFVIDRLCKGPAPVTDIIGKCYASSTASGGGGTKKAGGIAFTSAQTVYYRITARVSGPRNTVSFAQTIVSR